MSQPTNSLPTSTITFLFTDIDGSTECWEKHREAMARVMDRHEVRPRLAIESHGGTVFETIATPSTQLAPTPWPPPS